MMGGMPGMTPWGMQAPMSNYGGGYGMDPQAQMVSSMVLLFSNDVFVFS